jgi:peptidyl-prolyl cis-trans isomerase C
MRHWFLLARRSAFVFVMMLFCAPGWPQQAQASKPGAKDTAEAGSAKKADSANRAVITVDNTKLTAADVENFVHSLPPRYQAFYSGQGRKYLPIYLVRMQILLGEARKEKLDDQPEVKRAIQIATDSILSNAAQERMEKKIQISDNDVEALYEKQKPQLEEARIRRILIHTDASPLSLPNQLSHSSMPFKEAWSKLMDLRKEILAGADFATLAKANSDDAASAGKGGDMGYVTRADVVPPVADAAFSLKPGEVSNVIQSPYGLELIQVEDRREKPLPEVREQLEKEIRQAKVNQMIQDLVEKHTVLIDKDYFGSASVPGSSATSAKP